MESTLLAFKRPPSNGFGENNALPRRMHEKRKEKKRWTPSEDLKLKEIVAVYGPQNWKHIGDKMEVKTGRSCRFRWLSHLDPRINKKAFTGEEDAKLLAAQKKRGNKWSKIVELLPGRTDIAVKTRWHQLKRCELKKQSVEETKAKYLREAMEYSARRHQFSALFTQHVSISQPSSPSLPSQAKDTKEARYFKTNQPPKFIDFLGVGDS